MQIDNYNFKGKRALIRVDYNVPIDKDSNKIADDTRIRLSIPTLKKVLNKHHINGALAETYSTKVAAYLWDKKRLLNSILSKMFKTLMADMKKKCSALKAMDLSSEPLPQRIPYGVFCLAYHQGRGYVYQPLQASGLNKPSEAASPSSVQPQEQPRGSSHQMHLDDQSAFRDAFNQRVSGCAMTLCRDR